MNSGSTSSPDNSAAHRATTASRPRRSHAPATRSFGVAVRIVEVYEPAALVPRTGVKYAPIGTCSAARTAEIWSVR